MSGSRLHQAFNRRLPSASALSADKGARKMIFTTRVRIFAVLALFAATAARGETWTGLAAPNNNWATAANWDTTVPVSGSTAVFNNAGNGNTTVSLGGTTQQ